MSWKCVRRVALVCGLLLVLSFASLWLALHRVPSWYRPAVVDEADRATVRADALALVDSISDQMVQGRPFTIELTTAEVNQLLTAMPYIWPDSLRDWPQALSGPAVSFESDVLRFGVTLSRSEDRKVIGVGIGITVHQEERTLRVRLLDVKAGALSLPQFVMDPWVKPWIERARGPRAAALSGSDPLRASLANVKSIGDVFEPGVVLQNRFIWPNGERRFRIGAVIIQPGMVRVRIEPF